MSEPPNDTFRPANDPLYQKGAEAVYASYREGSVEAAKLAAGYGKWLVSSILLLHTGAIAGLLTFMGAIAGSGQLRAEAYADAIGWFVWGIVAILGCGFFAMLNCSWISVAYDHYVRPWMLVDPKHFPTETAPGGWKITATWWASVGLGWLSVGLLLRGACLVGKAFAST